MNCSKTRGLAGMVGLALTCAAPLLRADEGMWLFNKPPVRLVAERYGYEIRPEWLEHLQRSAVNFGGGSGSFVSAHGLILTNHHVGARSIASLSTPQDNLMEDGFLAGRPADERRCEGLELRVLRSILDVTAEVTAAVAPEMTPEAAVAARRAVIARLQEVPAGERELTRRDVIQLYQGGAWHLYEYRRYTDIRLVFAPERRIGAFGGDPDNFEFPRYCLDCCFFRAYENGSPAATPDFLKWSGSGAREGELVFVAGHPGSTSRALTQDQVRQMRDVSLPQGLDGLYRKEAMLGAWSARDPENRRRALSTLTGIQNGRKSRAALLDGLLDASFFGSRAEREAHFRRSAAASPAGPAVAAAYDAIARETAADPERRTRGRMLSGGAFDTALFGFARTLVQGADESLKPDAERLPGYTEARRKTLEVSLFSDRPLYPDLEIVKLGGSLTELCATLGADDPMVKTLLAGKSPAARAAELVGASRLADPAVRRGLYEGGKAAIDASDDPMIGLAKAVDAEARELDRLGDQSGEIVKQAHAVIARARFDIDGDAAYPDATGSLRLSFGRVAGVAAANTPFRTTFGGLFGRMDAQGGLAPFDLPPRWIERRSAVDPQLSFNFISTNDITGGNSGSPVVNGAGELVGLIFDGNAASLVNSVAYDETAARAVSVDSAGILEALRKVYQAEALAAELAGARPAP